MMFNSSVSRCPSDLRVVNRNFGYVLVVFSVNFHLLYQLVSSVIKVCRCVMAVSKSECCIDIMVSSRIYSICCIV
jgi:hypothetical protein